MERIKSIIVFDPKLDNTMDDRERSNYRLSPLKVKFFTSLIIKYFFLYEALNNF